MTKSTQGRRAKSRPDPTTCRDVISLIADYLSGELDRRTKTEFEAHVSDCGDCQAFLNTYRKTLEVTRSLAYETLPVDLQDRALAFLRNKLKTASRRR